MNNASGFKMLALLALIGGLAIFILQNLSAQLALPLVFFGSSTFVLPVIVWMVLFAIAGLLTSIFVQLLHNFSPGQQRQTREQYQAQPFASRVSQQEQPRQVKRSPDEPNDTAQRLDWEVPNSPDWEPQDRNRQARDDNNRDWNIEQAPQEPTNPSINLKKEAPDYEVRKKNTRVSRSDSTYSYGYDEPKDSGVGKTEQVYDANYRVIRPPYNPPSQGKKGNNEEEDWGFDEEELQNPD